MKHLGFFTTLDSRIASIGWKNHLELFMERLTFLPWETWRCFLKQMKTFWVPWFLPSMNILLNGYFIMNIGFYLDHALKRKLNH
jgi:hypothetical protein